MKVRHFLLLALLTALLSPAAGALDAAPTASAHLTCQTFFVRSSEKSIHAYTLDGYNYVRLRDFGRILDFAVSFDASAGTASISSQASYEKDGGAGGAAWPETASALPSRQRVEVNGAPADLQGYLIGGYNYFRLRDLARALDVQAIYDGAREAVELNPDAHYFEQQGNTLVLMYHAFCDTEAEALQNPKLYTTPARFSENLRDLMRLGFEPLTLEEYYAGRAEPDKKYFIVTIDDGYLDNYQIAYPLLQELGLHADIFCVVQDLSGGRSNHFTYPQAREMEKSGLVSIHSHNLRHERASDFDSTTLSGMLTTAYHSLSVELGKKDIFLAYPYGDHSKQSYLLAKRAGYKLQLVQGRRFAADDILVRMDVYYDTDVETLTQTAVYN